ncbi:MAG TPA: hypothetical protein VIV12_11660 [Streptosporangiaceae bacterium]
MSARVAPRASAKCGLVGIEALYPHWRDHTTMPGVVDCAMQLRRWVVAGVATVVVAGGAAAYLWRAQAPAHVRPGNTVSLRDGQVTFRAPKGWRREACPSGRGERPLSGACAIFRPPGGAAGDLDAAGDLGAAGDFGDAVAVFVFTPDPHAPEADLSRLLLDPAVSDPAVSDPAVRYFTVDGVRFAQYHRDAGASPVAWQAFTLVLGVLPNNDDVRVLCSEQAEPKLVRAGCQVVIDSLHVRT